MPDFEIKNKVDAEVAARQERNAAAIRREQALAEAELKREQGQQITANYGGDPVKGTLIPAGQQQTSNLSTNWYTGKTPTTKEIYARIGQIYQQDKKRGADLVARYQQLQRTPGNPLYNVYASATNRSVANLQAYGIDTSKIDDTFFAQNDYLRQYLKYDGTTNTPSKPGVKASAAEKAAYEYYQIWSAEDTTRKAESEWEALQKEITYWTQHPGRNLSDEEVLAKIDWGKYGTLTSMDENAAFKPTELNRAIGYSRDNLYGVMWAARNGGGTGNLLSDNIYSAMNEGYQWQANDELTKRLDAGSYGTDHDTYNPYSVGSTMEKEGQYFGVYNFDQKWVDDHRAEILNGSDEKAKEYFANIVKALDYTNKLKTQLNDMYTDINGLLLELDDPEQIIETIKESTDLYGDLFDLDDTLKLGPTGLKSTTSAVDYRWQDIEQKIRDACAKKQELISTGQVIRGFTQDPEASDAEKALADYYKQNVDAALPTIREEGTPEEKTAATTGKIEDPDAAQAALTQVTVDQKSSAAAVTKMAVDELWGYNQTIYDYDRHQTIRDNAQAELDRLTPEWEALNERSVGMEAISDLDASEYQALMGLKDLEGDPTWDYYRRYLELGEDKMGDEAMREKYDSAQLFLYQRVRPDDPTSDRETIKARADEWWKFMNQQTSPIPSIESIIAGLNKTGDDADAIDDEIPGTNVTIHLEKDENGQFVFDYATDSVWQETWGADQIDDLEAHLHRNELKWLSPEEEARLEMLTQARDELQQKIEDEDSYLGLNRSMYEEAQMDKDFLLDTYAAAASVSGGEIDPSLLPTLNYAFNMGQEYTPTQWTDYTMYDLALQDGSMTVEEVSKEATAASAMEHIEAEALRGMLESLDAYGAQVPDEYRKNIQRRIDALERDAKSSSYYMIDSASDYDAMVAQGKALAEKSDDTVAKLVGTGKKGTNWLYSLTGIAGASSHLRDKGLSEAYANDMTQEEKNRYFYLLAKDGVKAANDYYKMLIDPDYGVVAVRESQERKEEMREFAKQNGWAAGLSTLASFGTNFAGGPAALMYELVQWASGKEVNPYSEYFAGQDITEAARAGSKEWLGEVFGKDNKVATMFYDALVSHVDSAINAAMMNAAFSSMSDLFGSTAIGRFFDNLTFAEGAAKEGVSFSKGYGAGAKVGSWLGSGKLSAKIGNFLVKAGTDVAHASTMGLNAAAAAYRNAIMKGASPEQAMGMFTATFWAETGSEAITVENLHDAFALGSDVEKRGITEFVKQFFKAGAGEFFGEGINEYIEQKADQLIMGALSDYDATVKSYTDQGYPESLAKELANKEMWTEVLRAGAVGFISAGMGTAAGAAKGAINERLNREEPYYGERGYFPPQQQATEETKTEEAPAPDRSYLTPENASNLETGIVQQEATPEAPVQEGTTAEDVLRSRYGMEEDQLTPERAPEEPNTRIPRSDFEVTPDANPIPENAPVAPQQPFATITGPDGTTTQVPINPIDTEAEADQTRRDAVVLGRVYSKGDPTAVTTAIASVINTGSSVGDRATAQTMVANMAGGKPRVAVAAMRGLMNANVPATTGVSLAELKQELSRAALTKGAGHEALQRVFDTKSHGGQITADDVKAIVDGLNQDRAVNPDSFDEQYAKAIRESRVANYTVRNMAQMKDRLRAADAEVQQAADVQAQTQQVANDAHARVQAVAGNLQAAQQIFIPVNPNAPVVTQNAGAVQQTRNELLGAMTAAQQADDAVAAQEARTKKARKKRKQVREDAMAEARAQAEQQVAEEEAQAQQTAEEGRQQHPTTVPFQTPITVKQKYTERPVQLTGILIASQEKHNTMYSTPEGYITDADIHGIMSAEVRNLRDQALMNGMQNPVDPPAWLPHSLKATTSDGKTVDIIGLAGVDTEGETILAGPDGSTYRYDDLIMEDDPFTGKNGDDAFFQLTDDINYDNLPIVEAEQRSGTDDTATESTTETPVEQNVSQSEEPGDNLGELPVESGEDVGPGDQLHVGPDGRESPDGRNETSATQPDRQSLRRSTPRLLSPKIRNLLKTKDVTDLKLRAETDRQRFSTALDEAKASNPHGLFVDAQSPEDLEKKGAIMILSDNGRAGAAVGTVGSEKGNIFGVFKHKKSKAKGASVPLIIQAVASGGNKLDCYDGALRRIYASVGMVPVARVAWNDAYHRTFDENGNVTWTDGWNYERDGTPDVVFWMHNGDSPEVIATKYAQGSYHQYTDDEIKALPLFEDTVNEKGETTEWGYDKAFAYRDQLLQQQLDQQTKEGVPQSNIQALRVHANKAAEKSATPTEQYVTKLKGKLQSPQQIAHQLVKSLKFGNYLGSNNFGNMSQDVRGYWEKHAQLLAVRNRDIGDYTATIHEVGHGVAQMLGLEGDDLATQTMVDTLLDAEPDFRKYSDAELKGEAFAEFMWRYMANEQLARDFAGDAFYDQFEKRLRNDPGLAKPVLEAQARLKQWVNADDNAKLGALIRNEQKEEKQPLRDAIRTVINEIADRSSIAEEVNAHIRKTQGVKKLNFNDDLRAQSLLSNHSQKRALQNLTTFLTDADGTIKGDGLAERFAKVGFEATEENIKLLEQYALLKHSLYRDEQNKPVFGNMSREAREARIAEIERTRKYIVDAEAAWQSFRHDFLQNWMVDTGYWTQEMFDHMEEIYPHYVPTYRVRGEGDPLHFLGSTRAGKKYTLKAATGGSQDIYSPFYSFIGMVDQITSMVATNKVAQTFDRLYEQNEGMGIFGRQIPHMEEAIDPETGEVMVDDEGKPVMVQAGEPTGFGPKKNGELNYRQKKLQEALKDVVGEDIMQRVLDIASGNPGVKQPTASNSLLTVQRADGTTVQYEIDNPELFKLLTGAQGSSGIRALQVVGNLTRAMSMLTTGSNPLFAARNAARDFQNSVNYGTWASNYLSGAIKWAKAFKQVWRGSEDFDAYQALGGGGWTRIQQGNSKSMGDVQNQIFDAINDAEAEAAGRGYFGTRWDAFKRGFRTANNGDKVNVGKTTKWAAKKLWDTVTMERLNEIIEQTSRFAEYKYGKHDLSTAEGRQEAFLAAQDATVDFSRSGNSEAAYVLKKLVPFFNASMQGVYRTARQGTQAERENVGHRLTKTFVNTALASLLGAGLILKFGDDDDKEEFMRLSDGVKANHLILPNPLAGQSGQPPFLRIPLAQDPLSYAIHGAVTNLTNAILNGEAEDELAISLAATADVILDNLNPLGSGTIAQPFIDVSHNRTWYGSSIVRNGQSDWTDAASQYNEDTPELFKALGRMLNTSPEIVEYLAQQYTGFIGAIGIPALSQKNGRLGGFDAIMQSAVKKWTADPSSSNDVTKNFYNMKSLLSTITGEAGKDRPQGLLLRSLTQDQVNEAYEQASKMQKKGGIVYETAQLINDSYRMIDDINANDTLTDAQKYDQTTAIKKDMLKWVESANEQLNAYYKKYIGGETLTDQLFGGIRKRFEQGAYAHVKTDVEKMPQVFQNDSESKYMQRALSTYEATGKASVLPHPTQEFTVTDSRGNETDYAIPDDEWDYYVDIYRRAYEQYVTRKGARWETMNDYERSNLMKSAHTSANKKMREQFMKDHRSTSRR